jgi:hypothetical protein
MHNDVWIEIVKRIPADQHARIMLVTKAGLELSVEAIFKLDPSYFVIRGRQGGTTDNARVFFVPYCELNFLYLNKIYTEDEILAMCGETSRPESKPALAQLGETGTEAADSDPTAPSSQLPLPGRPQSADAAAAAKVNLLERIRAARASATIPRIGN